MKSPSTTHLETIGRQARRAIQWWFEGLQKASPSWLAGLFLGDTRYITLDVDDHGQLTAHLLASRIRPQLIAKAIVATGGLEPSVSRKPILAAGRHRPIELQAPGNLVLTQTVMLPTLALEDLRQAVKFGLSRWTPFSADEVVFAASPGRARDEHTQVRIDIVPRNVLEPMIRLASEAGLVITTIMIGSNSVDYTITDPQKTKRRRSDRIDTLLLSSVFALLASIFVLINARWSDELKNIQAVIHGEIAHRAKQISLESELARLEKEQRIVLHKRAKEPLVTTIVAEFSDILPENAEMIDFSWNGSRGQARISWSASDVSPAFGTASDLKIDTIGQPNQNRVIVDFSKKEISR